MSTPSGTTSQFPLFDLGPDWSHLRDAKEKLMRASKAPNTLKAYAHAWKQFSRWCAEANRPALPATEETVSLFVTWCLYEKQWRLATVQITLSAISTRHGEEGFAAPVTEEVRTLMRHAGRNLREKRAGKAALTPRQLRKICASLPLETTIGVRDRAMFVLGFAAGWRSDEICSLELADVAFNPKGVVLSLGASKTDQDGSEGRVVGLPRGEQELTCPVRALKAWLKVRGDWPGALFCAVDSWGHLRQRRLKADTLCTRLQGALERIGEDPRPYGAHSLRVGMVTASTENGANLAAIMQRTGHKTVSTVMRYVRPAQAFQGDPLAGVL